MLSDTRKPGRSYVTAACLVVLTLAVGWIWHPQITGEVTYLGNHDRLLYYLCNELGNFDTLKAHGQLQGWDDLTFGGVDRASLGSVGSNFSPAKVIMPWVSRPNFLIVAGLLPVILMWFSALNAFLLSREFVHPALAVIAALLYVCSTFSVLAFSQLDMAALVTAMLPLGAWIIYRGRLKAWNFAALVLAALPLVYLGFAPRSAYVIGFWLLLALGRSAATRSWWPVLLLVAALTTAICFCLPRILTVLAGLSFYQRTLEGSTNIPFDRLQDFFNVTPREWLRLLDEGIFGRFPQEAARFNNNINLNEGFQLYVATFASLLTAKVLLRFRGRWGGIFHWREGFLCYCAWTLVLVMLVIFFRPATHLVFLLFFKAPILHARISVIGVLPIAALTAAGLQEGCDFLATHRRTHFWLGLIGGSVAAVVLLVSLTVLQTPRSDLTAVDASRGWTHLLMAAWNSSGETLKEPTAPFSPILKQPDSKTIWLAWEHDDGAVDNYQVEQSVGKGAFRVIGEPAIKEFSVSGAALSEAAVFRICAVHGGKRSDYSPTLTTEAGKISPMFQPGESPMQLNSSSVIKVSVCVAIFLVALILSAWRTKSAALGAAWLGFMATLITVQAVTETQFRVNGPQTRSFPLPFVQDNYFNAPQGTLIPPSDAAIQQLGSHLDPRHWRTVFITPSSISGFAAPHVAKFWQLRTVEGYLSGVPQRLAALPWPKDTLGFRTLAFRKPEDLDWDLLGKLNVRYAATITPELYFNLPGADALTVIENPRPVTPRVFFARHTKPAQAFVANTGKAVLPDAPQNESWVEGMDTTRDWPAEGKIDAEFADDRITLRFPANPAPRFVVLNEMYHPGWKAFSGGSELVVHPTNTFMRGLEVPPGTSEIDLSFTPLPPLGGRWLFPLAGLALLAVTLTFLAGHRRFST